MTASAHLEELTRKHRNLDHLIEKEMAKPSASDLEITELKRRKLRIKEQIEGLVPEVSH